MDSIKSPIDENGAALDAERAKAETGWRNTIIIGLAAVLFAVAAVVFFVQRGEAASTADPTASTQIAELDLPAAIPVDDAPGSEDNTAFVDVAETQQVAVTAREILTAIYTYDHETIDGHAERIKPLMTAGMLEQYQTSEPPNAEIIKQAKTKVQASIQDSGIGVVSITGDTAIVEALLGIQGDNDGVSVLKAQSPVRMLLTKVDGKWIAANIQTL